MALRQYIGARYVPRFLGTYDATQEYEALDVVDNGSGTSYIARIPVPAGIPLTNTTYWFVYGSTSGAIINLQNQIDTINNTTIPAITDDIKDLVEKTDTAMFYFPPIKTGTFQAASCMMIIDKKAVIFDCGAADSKAEMMAYYTSLYNAGIFEEVSKIIISHFHIDHMGNFEDVLAAFPHDNCTVYIPINPDGYYAAAVADGLVANRQTIIDACVNEDVPYVEVDLDTTLDINDYVSIELFNSTYSDYSYYSSISSEYNNYSMVSLVKIGKVYALFAGDVQYDAETRIMSQRTLPRVFLYAINHHALQWDDDVAYMNAISPEWGVAQISPNRVRAMDALIAKYCAKHICASAYSDHIFAVGKDGGYVVNGSEVQTLCGPAPNVKIYVDNSYTGSIKDGSSARPFVDIADAINFTKFAGVITTIYVTATGTTYTTPRLTFIDDITIQGVASGTYTKPVINGISIKDCNKVILNNIIFEGIQSIDSAILYAETSYVRVTDCDFVGVTASPQDIAIRNQNSEMYVYNNTFTSVRGILSLIYGTYYVGNNTFTDCAFAYTLLNSKVILKSLDTINNVTKYIETSNSVGITPLVVAADLADITAITALMASNSANVRSESFIAGNKSYRVYGNNIITDPKTHVIRKESTVTTGTNGSVNLGANRATKPIISVNVIDSNANKYAIVMSTLTTNFCIVRNTSDDSPVANTSVDLEIFYADLTGEDAQS